MKALTNLSFKRLDKKQVEKRAIIPISIRHVSISDSQTGKHSSVADMRARTEHDQDIPTEIVASYVNDFNLLHIHETIIRKLKTEPNGIDVLEKALKKQLDIIKTPQTIVERKQTKKRIHALQDQIEDIQTGKRLKVYLDRTEPLIAGYKTMIPKKRKIDFTATKAKKMELMDEEEKNPQYWKKMRLIREYLAFAQRYIDITIIQRKKNVNKCGCGCDLNNVFIDNFGAQICPECRTDRYIIGFNLYKSDTLASRNDYSDRDNFEKALMRYQGKQIDKIPEPLFKDLDEHFKARGKPTSAEIKALPLNERGHKDGTDLHMLHKALLDTGYSSLYEDSNLIAHQYWGWTLPDVSHLEDIIMEDYEKTQRVYIMLPKERSSSLGTQFRLFKHLELRGHPCTVSDFKIVKMLESLEYHDETWRIMCDDCGDPEIYFIPTI